MGHRGVVGGTTHEQAVVVQGQLRAVALKAGARGGSSGGRGTMGEIVEESPKFLAGTLGTAKLKSRRQAHDGVGMGRGQAGVSRGLQAGGGADIRQRSERRQRAVKGGGGQAGRRSSRRGGARRQQRPC